MKFFLNNNRAIARAFAAGYTVWAANAKGELEEGRDVGNCPSFRYARRLAREMVQDNPGAVFIMNGERYKDWPV